MDEDSTGKTTPGQAIYRCKNCACAKKPTPAPGITGPPTARKRSDGRPSVRQLPPSPRSSLSIQNEDKYRGPRAAKRMSQSSSISRLSYLSAALQDRRALLLGYVKNDVVTQDRLALLWTIEAACGGSPSRASETHPILAAPALVPACGPDSRAVFKELAVVGSPLRSVG